MDGWRAAKVLIENIRKTALVIAATRGFAGNPLLANPILGVEPAELVQRGRRCLARPGLVF